MIDYMRSKDARYALARTHPKDWGWVLPPCGVGPQDSDTSGRRIHLFATGSMAFGPKPCNHCGNDTGFEMGVSPLPPGDLSGPLTCHNCGKVPTVSGAEGAAARRMRAED